MKNGPVIQLSKKKDLSRHYFKKLLAGKEGEDPG